MFHNYGFDRHIFYNHGINVRGFGGDTMHMARLFDSSRNPGEYSLASLTKHFEKGIAGKVGHYIDKKLNYYKSKL